MLNLTQHLGTAEQGVNEPKNKALVQKLLTFEELPDFAEMVGRAEDLAEICKEVGENSAMIGGAPFFMAILEKALAREGIKAFYAFSVRESIDKEDGTKVSVFRHKGFIEAM